MIAESGKIFYQDEYGTIFDVEWETVNGNLDITSKVQQPFIWGQTPRGYVRNHRVFRYGIIMITRQLLQKLPSGSYEILEDGTKNSGYVIIAEGTSYYFDYIQVNFICETQPRDNFAYHIDCGICDEIESLVEDGLQYTDPDGSGSDTVWGDVLPDGTPIVGTVPVLEWMDVWSN